MILTFLAFALATPFPRYTITDLGIDEKVERGGMGSVACINDAGLVAGTQSKAVGGDHGFSWSAGKTQWLAELPSSSYSLVTDINQKGQICGCVGDVRNTLPAVWTGNKLAATRDFQPSDSRWTDINDKAETVGFGFDMTDPDPMASHPYFSMVKRAGGEVHKLPKTVAGQVLDNDGTILGTSETPDFIHRVVRLAGESWEYLNPPLNGVVAVNRKGVILGTQPIDAELDESVIWEAGKLIDCPDGHFLAINDAGVAVGETGGFFNGNGHAVISSNGVTVDLNSLLDKPDGWLVVNASGINNNGQIVGAGLHNGKGRFFLLTPK